ncbi:VOC family protein [Nonomuraea sp. NPDC050536]|uniref:VOC family protein n=1 Tax=Nonomuraea sp. NPDC050536 TaxID=3364366 RepID=UPI0037CACC75
MLRGIATVVFTAEDVEAAKEWYTELLGVEAYFSRPGPDGRAAYVEFRIGDYQTELGLLDRRFSPQPPGAAPGGVSAHWAVDDIEATFQRLLAMGAKEYEPITTRGEGFVTASVVDPFGNVLGIMHNTHYLAVLGA